MMMAPNFIPRGSGIVIRNYFNCEGGVIDCNCCKSSVRGRSCTNISINLERKLKGDEIKYIYLIKASFGKANNNAFRIRLKALSNKFKGEIFLNQSYKERFYGVFHKQNVNIYSISPSYIATLFFLTVDEMLWKLLEEAFIINGFDFSQIRLRQISTEGYVLYQTAKTISTGKKYIRISEIADEDLINYKTIINASLIVMYDADIFLITK